MLAIPGTRRQIRELVDGTLEIKLHVEPRHKKAFLELLGEIDMPVAIAPLRPDFEQKPQAPGESYGHYAAALYKVGFFFNPNVLRALGTDDEYMEWIQRQPSAYSGKFSEYVDGEGRCVAAHVRRAGESGTAYKAEYACIPLTDEEHRRQHKEGESALGGKEWFDKERRGYVQEWAHQRLREELGVESLADASPQMVCAWAERNDLLAALPIVYRDHGS